MESWASGRKSCSRRREHRETVIQDFLVSDVPACPARLREVDMICAELEKLEASLDDIITRLEGTDLSPAERANLERAYARLSQSISSHQKSGHEGGPCFEE